MNQKNKIAILGCGWLGITLAKKLIKKNFLVKGSTTSFNKIDKIEAEKIEAHLLLVEEKKIIGNISDFLKNVKTLIINFPPSKTTLGKYSKKVQKIIVEVKKSNVKNILFISSTSVYGNNEGIINYDCIPIPSSFRGNEILKAEKIIQGFKNSCIIRFGGLIGKDRNPAISLSNKKNVKNPDHPINLIHLDDCIGIILSIIKKNIWGKVFLGVSPYHPNRKEFYNNQCKALGLKEIYFSKINMGLGKKINDQNISTELGYEFKRPKF